MDDDGDFVVAWEQGREVRSGNGFACSYGVGLCTFVGGYSVQLRRYTGGGTQAQAVQTVDRSEEHTSELPSLMRISYAVICLTKTLIRPHHAILHLTTKHTTNEQR